VIAIESNPVTLDPRFATDAYSERITRLLYSSLVRVDATFEIVPELAERWEQPDPRSYRFFLRRGVHFHDGHELTAEDVRYTFASMLDPSTASPHRAVYEMIDRITVRGPHEIEFHLNAPHAPFLVNLVKGIVPAHLAGPMGRDFGQQPVGSGPFRLVRWLPDDRLELAPFAGHAGGAPPLAGIAVKIVPEETIRLLELQKGHLDLAQNNIPLEVLPLIEADGRFRVMTAPSTTYSYLGMNLRRPPLADVRVRRALAHAIDRATIIRTLLGGLAVEATGLLASAHWAYEPAVARYDYDPTRAKALLDEAGLVDPDGDGPQPRVELSFKTSQNELARRIAQVIQQQLAQVGIGMTIRSYEWGTFYADIKSGNFELYTLSWVGIVDPDIYYDVFHSASVPPAGSNRGGYRNPAVDRLAERGRRTADPRERRAIYEELQRIVADEVPYVSLWYPMNVVVLKQRVEGFVPSPSGDWDSLAHVTLGDDRGG
jgi:peptide/nickel transport system substrate-binding protein